MPPRDPPEKIGKSTREKKTKKLEKAPKRVPPGRPGEGQKRSFFQPLPKMATGDSGGCPQTSKGDPPDLKKHEKAGIFSLEKHLFMEKTRAFPLVFKCFWVENRRPGTNKKGEPHFFRKKGEPSFLGCNHFLRGKQEKQKKQNGVSLA